MKKGCLIMVITLIACAILSMIVQGRSLRVQPRPTPILSTQDQIEVIARSEFGDRLQKVTFAEGVTGIYYQGDPGILLTEKGILDQALTSLGNLSEKIFSSPELSEVIQIDLYTTALFIDEYGSESPDLAAHLVMPRDLSERITWKNITPKRLAYILETLGDGSLIHLHVSLKDSWNLWY